MSIQLSHKAVLAFIRGSSPAAMEIDYFESYADTAALQSAWAASDTTNFQRTLEETVFSQGSKAMKLAVTTSGLNATITKTLTGGDILDLTGKNTIKFDARATATGGNLEFSIRDSGNENSGNLFIEADTDISDKNGTHTITAVGTAALSSVKFSSYNNSTASILFDGNSDWLETETSTIFAPDGNMTYDAWVYTGTQGYVFDSRNSVTVAPCLYITGGNFVCFYNNSEDNISVAIPAASWSHVAVVISGSNLKFFVNGVEEGSETHDFSDSSTRKLYIGVRYSHDSAYFNSYIDNFRFTKGTALWTANFNLTDAELFYAKRQTHTITISSVDTYQEEEWDISGVADADKDAIDQLQLKVIGTMSNADFVDENCSALGSWTDSDTGTAASIQATFDGQETFKLDTGASAAASTAAHRVQDFGSLDALGNRIIAEIKVYCDAIGTVGDVDALIFALERSDLKIAIAIASDGLFIDDGVGYNEVGTNLVVQDTWQTWTFDIDLSAGVANAVCDVYLEGILQASAFDCSNASVRTDGTIRIYQQGYTTANRISYVDYIKIGSAFQFTGDHYIDNVRAE